MRKFLLNESKWLESLARAELNYNCTPSETLGNLSPFQAEMGWNPRLSGEYLLESAKPRVLNAETVEKRKMELAAVHKLVTAKQAGYNGKGGKQWKTFAGQRVWLSTANLPDGLFPDMGTRKWRKKWLGPVVVKRVISEGRVVELDLSSLPEITQSDTIFSTDHLRPA